MAIRTITQNTEASSLETSRAPRAYVIGMPLASMGLWMALLAPALVVLAISGNNGHEYRRRLA